MDTGRTTIAPRNSVLIKDCGKVHHYYIGKIFAIRTVSYFDDVLVLLKKSNSALIQLTSYATSFRMLYSICDIHFKLFHDDLVIRVYSGSVSECFDFGIVLSCGTFTTIEWRYIRYQFGNLSLRPIVVTPKFFDAYIRNSYFGAMLRDIAAGASIILEDPYINISISSLIKSVSSLSTWLSRSRTSENTSHYDVLSSCATRNANARDLEVSEALSDLPIEEADALRSVYINDVADVQLVSNELEVHMEPSWNCESSADDEVTPVVFTCYDLDDDTYESNLSAEERLRISGFFLYKHMYPFEMLQSLLDFNYLDYYAGIIRIMSTSPIFLIYAFESVRAILQQILFISLSIYSASISSFTYTIAITISEC